MKTLIALCSLAWTFLAVPPELQAQNAPPPLPPLPTIRRPVATNVVAPAAQPAPAQARPALGATNAALSGPPPQPSFKPLVTPPPRLAGGTNAILPPSGNLGALAEDDTLPEGTLTRVQGMPLDQFLEIYALVTGRIVLRPSLLPAVQITLDATQQKLTKSEAINAMDTVLELNGITMLNTGDKFVTAVPSTQALQEGAAFSNINPDKLPEGGQFVTKVVQLKYALPSEIQPLIASFSKIPNGIVPIDSTQTLVLRDYAANIKRMMEIINKVDVEVESDYKLEVIPIRYGKVEDIYATMGSLIGGGVGGAGAVGARQTGARGARGAYNRGNMGMNANSPFGMNTMGGNPMGGNTLGTTQNRFGQQGVGTTGFNQQLQRVVSSIAGQGQNQLLHDAKIVPDERSNSLIVFASKEDLRMITNVVEKVDRQMAQVLIEAVIMDVQLNNELTYGVQAYLQDQSGSLNSQGFLNSGSGALTNALTSGGLGYLGSYNNNITFLVQALSSKTKAEVLSTPSILTSHALPASFSVGQTVPYVTGSGAGVYGTPYTSFSQLQINTELDVTPFITPDNLVVMDIQQHIEDLTGFKTFPNVGDLPLTVQRDAQSTVSVQDGDTIMLGGYIRNNHSLSKNGVPILQDIPGLGALFRSTSKAKDRSELVVFLRPTILRTPHDAAIFAGKMQQRLPGVREMQKDMKEDEAARQKHANQVTGADQQ